MTAGFVSWLVWTAGVSGLSVGYFIGKRVGFRAGAATCAREVAQAMTDHPLLVDAEFCEMLAKGIDESSRYFWGVR